MKYFKTLLLVLAPAFLFAQISRNQWLVGGGFSGRYQSNSISDYKDKDAIGNEDVGYFVLNKLAVGIRGTQRYSQSYTFLNDINYNRMVIRTKSFSITAGPFIRYYFFPETNRFNLYSEFYYGYGFSQINFDASQFSGQKNKSHTYNLNIAPVFMINQHASAQFIVGYYLQTQKNINYTNLLVGIGLQMHLGKGKSSEK